ncbi:uncharacterized protein LOC134224347 [Armigeres subalbatus]|uniref:uncharacterized protein LOC134224347 n=1 Tax=Armigeres subalbatus TaxID=124917 RepID=UPI002ED07440
MAAVLPTAHLQTVGSDCNGKTFLCTDDLHYQICSPSSSTEGTETTDLQVYECDTSQYCSNANTDACSSSASSTSTATTLVSSTTSSETVSQSSTTDNGSSTTSSTSSSSSTTIVPTTSSETVSQSSTTDDGSSTTSTTSSSSSSTTIDPTTTELPFSCDLTGRYPHSSDCHKYHLCVVLPFFNYDTVGTCLFGTVFDPDSQRCTADQNKCQLQPQSFNCTSAGRFPDPSDSTRYFWCRWNAFSSSYELIKMKCPFGITFDASKAKCSGFFGND